MCQRPKSWASLTHGLLESIEDRLPFKLICAAQVMSHRAFRT